MGIRLSKAHRELLHKSLNTILIVNIAGFAGEELTLFYPFG